MEKFLTDSKKIVTLLLMVLLFSACTKWLDIAPEKDLYQNNFWKTTKDANSALAATYSTFRSAALESFIFGELRGDMAKLSGGNSNLAAIASSDINPTNPAVDWSTYYKTIALANIFMYYDKNVLANDKSFTPKMKNGMDAEALFLRSLSYFYLVRLWKNVPLVTNPSISDTCNIYPVISDEPVIIKQIITDLLIAKDKAYTTYFQDKPNYFKGRANKYSIMTLLADVYLWDQQYQKCIDYCDSVTNSNLYSLLPATSWFTLYNPGNSNESIFELQFEDDGSTNDQVNPFFTNGWINLNSGKTGFAATNKYNNLFPDISDIRACNGRTLGWKYEGITVDNDLMRSSVSQKDAHIIYYRYADILLMKAEALNELGRVTEAQGYVSQTNDRAYPTSLPVITDQLEMRNAILDERAKEFSIEGKRWFDIVRAGKRNHFENKGIIADVILLQASELSLDVLRSKVNDTMMYYLPVPYSELTRNKKLKQNPFYER